jgi:acyl-CoA thioesterase I
MNKLLAVAAIHGILFGTVLCKGQSLPEQAAADSPRIADQQTYLKDLCDQLKVDWPKNHTINLVCHGHSVPAGYTKTPEVDSMNAYPHLWHEALSAKFPHAVINVIVTAIGGENAEQGAARFERDVLSLRPQLVTIDYALNDRRIGLKRAKKAWVAMIEKCQAAGIPLILLTPTGDTRSKLLDPEDRLNQHARQIRQLAAQYHVGLADSTAAYEEQMRKGTKLEEMISVINHPNRRGHEMVVQELMKWFP